MSEFDKPSAYEPSPRDPSVVDSNSSALIEELVRELVLKKEDSDRIQRT